MECPAAKSQKIPKRSALSCLIILCFRKLKTFFCQVYAKISVSITQVDKLNGLNIIESELKRMSPGESCRVLIFHWSHTSTKHLITENL